MACYDWNIYWLCNKVCHIYSSTSIESDMLSSIKWIGLFVTALVGLYTIEDLWEKFGDLKMSVVCMNRSDTLYAAECSG